jgi:epoxyqueuosine reductase QueG
MECVRLKEAQRRGSRVAAESRALLQSRLWALKDEVKAIVVEEGMDIFGCYCGAYAAPLTGFPWARSVIVFGLGIKEKELLVGVRQEGWNRAKQFVDQILDLVAYKVSNLLLKMGYESEVISSSQPSADIRRLAAIAGVGTIGRNGLVITPEFGPRARFAGVATSAILSGSEQSVPDLCLECNACIEACPASAIGETFDARRCYEYNLRFERGGSFRKCTLCTDVCPGGRGRGATPGL